MTNKEQTLLMFRGLIASLDDEKQTQVKQAEQAIRDVIKTYPDGAAVIALGLICAENYAEE